MENHELVQAQAATPTLPPGQMAALPPEVAQAFNQMAQTMRVMADMVRAINDRQTAMEREIRLLTKVTPAQAAAINAAIRTRAAELCKAYKATGQEKATANAIRRAVKLTTGVSTVRELPRCEYSVALEQVQLWDDYKAMKAIKAKATKEGAK